MLELSYRPAGALDLREIIDLLFNGDLGGTDRKPLE